jgi:excisionase family DNA binding protein
VDERDRRGVERLTIQQAARRLGVSEGAVRKRVTRGTLRHEKDDDGRVYVYLDAGGIQGVDEGQDAGVDPNSNALISQLRDEVAYLRDENRRKDEIIMQQAMTMRQLIAAPSQEATEAAETVEEAPEGAGPNSEAGEAREELVAERALREMAEATLHEGMAEERRRREEAERERDGLRRELFALRGREETHEAAEEQQGRAQPRSAAGGAQEGARRPWWRRMFGGG